MRYAGISGYQYQMPEDTGKVKMPTRLFKYCDYSDDNILGRNLKAYQSGEMSDYLASVLDFERRRTGQASDNSGEYELLKSFSEPSMLAQSGREDP